MKHLCFFILLCLATLTAQAQHLGLKTNLLYDATASVSLGVEAGLTNPKFTLDVAASYNNWDFANNKKWRHWLLQPELRYWLCEAFNGHFFGVHAMGGQFNFSKVQLPFKMYPQLKDYHYQGEFMGLGVAYGYQWILSDRWGIEATLGAGYLYINYKQYPCAECGEELGAGYKGYWGLTKAGLSILYFIN
ncbi:MAG: DUF3575 domain-containing protein [Prevotellaceae bacterium]|jgi:hypothetical protein|nr:DUF3575 domain-containing protein [Prevotellaceae bacterium]